MKEFFDTRIDDLGLPTRESNRLIINGIKTVNDLFKFCEPNDNAAGINAKARLGRIWNMGAKGADKIIANINSKKPEGVYLGMTMKELDKFKQENYSKEELEEYEKEKQALKDEEKQEINRRLFLSTPIEKIDMLFPQMSEVIKRHKIKSIKDLLLFKECSYYSDYEIAQIDLVISNLNMPNVSTHMSYEEVIDMCVTDEMLILLDALIEKNSALKSESTLKRTDSIREETIKRTTLENKKLRESVKEKEEIVKDLEELVEEKERLKDLDAKLDKRIEELLNRINYKGQKRI